MILCSECSYKIHMSPNTHNSFYIILLLRYNLAYIVFYLLGINMLIPWSFFITADDVSNKRTLIFNIFSDT